MNRRRKPKSTICNVSVSLFRMTAVVRLGTSLPGNGFEKGVSLSGVLINRLV
jgi:hypothetical protein